jgi:hypothetical protein
MRLLFLAAILISNSANSEELCVFDGNYQSEGFYEAKTGSLSVEDGGSAKGRIQNNDGIL